MTGLVVLTFVPALAALMFWLRARAEQRARIAAETQLAELRIALRDNADPQRISERRRRLFGIVAHELRSPISAIIGYQELLAEGILGPLSDRSIEATGRIRNSALQLLNLTDGMYELAQPNRSAAIEREAVSLDELLASVVHRAAAEGAGRNVQLDFDRTDALPTISTDAERLRRTLDLMIAAAIKVSPDARLRIVAEHDAAEVTIRIAGSHIDPARDVPDADQPDAVMTGAGLRIAMARASAAAIDARLDIEPHDGTTQLRLVVPNALD